LGILNIFGKKDATNDITKGPPFSVATELFPYRLQAKKSSSATLIIKVRNITKEILLTSIVAEVPGQLGFDEMNLSKQREVRVGELQPDETKEIKLGLYSSLKSDPGEYTLTLTAIAHYRDYGHVLNAVKKRIAIEII
jgi:uncharacterized membrane protein